MSTSKNIGKVNRECTRDGCKVVPKKKEDTTCSKHRPKKPRMTCSVDECKTFVNKGGDGLCAKHRRQNTKPNATKANAAKEQKAKEQKAKEQKAEDGDDICQHCKFVHDFCFCYREHTLISKAKANSKKFASFHTVRYNEVDDDEDTTTNKKAKKFASFHTVRYNEVDDDEDTTTNKKAKKFASFHTVRYNEVDDDEDTTTNKKAKKFASFHTVRYNEVDDDEENSNSIQMNVVNKKVKTVESNGNVNVFETKTITSKYNLNDYDSIANLEMKTTLHTDSILFFQGEFEKRGCKIEKEGLQSIIDMVMDHDISTSPAGLSILQLLEGVRTSTYK